jgi:hypothetical protein
MNLFNNIKSGEKVPHAKGKRSLGQVFRKGIKVYFVSTPSSKMTSRMMKYW